MSGYTPLFDSIATGTLYGRWPDIGVWPIVLALADKHGQLDVTPHYLAGVLGLPVDDVSACMKRFCQPDPYSRTKTESGARLRLIDDHRDWGWIIVNHSKYREKARLMAKDTARTESGADAERKRTERMSPDVPRCPPVSPSQTQSQSQSQSQTSEKDTQTRARETEIPIQDPHVLPPDWDSQLRAVYPKRSGASGFGGVKLMLKIRTALAKTSWSEILAGVKRYAEYVEKSGEAGSRFVKGPANFFEEGCYLETFDYKAPEDPKVIEARNKEADRWRRAREAAGELDPALTPMPGECVAAFETRIRLASNGVRLSVAKPGGERGNASADMGNNRILSDRIASLTDRMRVAK